MTKNPVETIDQYLSEIYKEASNRDYNFNKHKINWDFKKTRMTVTFGQLNYERKHLLSKLQSRDIKRYGELKTISTLDSHPLFRPVDGDIEKWEYKHP